MFAVNDGQCLLLYSTRRDAPISWKANGLAATVLRRAPFRRRRMSAALDSGTTRPSAVANLRRHTEATEQGRRISFVIGGFTERGTAAGGLYLASKFPQIYRSVRAGYKSRQNYKDSRGDFLLVIYGPSRPDKFREWKPAFSPITPMLLHDAEIGCEWQERIKSRPSRAIVKNT